MQYSVLLLVQSYVQMSSFRSSPDESQRRSELPAIDGISKLTPAVWRQFRDRLCQIGFAAGYPTHLMRPGIGMHAASLQRPLVIWHMRQRRDAVAHVLRMFVLGDPIAPEDAAVALGRDLLNILIAAGIAVLAGEGLVVSAFVLRSYRGFLLFSDDLAHLGDTVYGAGYGTHAVCDFADEVKIDRALDVGCGAGALALWLSARANHVVATDINPRALEFVIINASLNGVCNISVRLGSLFEPVRGETFDFITSHLAYVPKAPRLTPATYLYGGPKGDELVRCLLSELPMFLKFGGRAMIVFEQAVAGGIDESVSALGGLNEAGLQKLFLFGVEVGADAYALRHAAPELRAGIDAFDRTATEMRAHLHETRIQGLRPVVCAMAKGGDADWTAAVQGGDDIWKEISGSMIARLMMAQTALRRSRIFGTRPRVVLPEGCLLIEPMVRKSDLDLVLGLPPGYPLPSIRFSVADWRALQDGEGSPLPEELLDRLASVGLLVDDACLPN